MRNIKLEQQLDGDEHWPYIATLKVAGDPSASPVPDGVTQPELESIIQTWDNIAVLQITPNVAAYFGFIIDDHAQYLNVPIETEDGKFGVHIGDSDVTFIAFAADKVTRPTLELVERVAINDEKYKSLPLY